MSKQRVPVVIPEEIHLMGLETLKFQFDTSDKFREDPVEINGFETNLGKEIAFNIEEGNVRCRLFIQLEAVNSENEKLGVFTDAALEFHFHIENFSQFIKLDADDKPALHVMLASTLVAIAYSTSRGIILEKTSNTSFKGILLPIVDATSYLLKDIEE